MLLEAFVTDSPLDVDTMAAKVAGASSGAVVTFSGNVRNHDGGRDVTALTYEIHPSAQSVLTEVVAEVAARHAINGAAVAHRFGPILIGEAAFVVAISAAHRKSAFDACREMVDVVKDRLPIWKHQHFADGTDEWVNYA